MIELSIIVVNWNTCSILQQCLKSIYTQIRGVKFEVIVIDNASTDGSLEMLRYNFPDVTIIANDTNRGFARANNQGIRVSQGRYILLLNSDTIVLNHAIDKVVSFADAHMGAAVVGCRILNPDKTLQPTCFMFPSIVNMLLSATYLYKVFPRSKFFGRERMSWWNRDDIREVDVVTGCFMLVRADAIEKVGMMDERFFMYGEETDWCYRFKQAGMKVLFTPSAEIIHLGGASSRQKHLEMILQLRGSLLLFFKKHYGYISYFWGCLLVALFFLLRIPYWLVLSLIFRKGRRRYLQNARAYITGVFFVLTGGRKLSWEKKFCQVD
jgi:GT2 family glycosyltransferase